MAAPKTQAATARRKVTRLDPVDMSMKLVDCRRTLRVLVPLRELPMSAEAAEDVDWTIRRVLYVMRELLGANG